MTSRGFTYKEVLLALIVVILAAAIVIPVTLSLQKRKLSQVDIGRMRNLYLSLAMYESQQSDTMPPTLSAIQGGLTEDSTFQSIDDPFLSGYDKYPTEPGLPKWRVDQRIRTSFSYLLAYGTAGKVKLKPWYEMKWDPKIGLLADEWQAKVTTGAPFEAQVDGPVLRLSTDGSLKTIARSGQKAIGDSQDLFFRQ